MKTIDANRSLWALALTAPFVSAAILEAMLEIKWIARLTVAHLPPYPFFILFGVASFLPSMFLMARIGARVGRRNAHMVISLFLLIVYSPLLCAEYFFVACFPFNRCNLL